MNEFIRFENVGFSYDTEDSAQNRQVLSHLDLTIERGNFVCILGHNGCGKSTLAKLTNAILVPTDGKVYVNGLDTASCENKNQIRSMVGMVFQNPDNQIVATIVEDDVAFGPENLGVEPTEIRQRVDNALKCVGMYELRKREPHKLSGGQKQRVAIAGVIAMETDCIVLDEPTAMLDPRGRKSVMETVQKLNKEKGLTVLYITHYMDEAVKADRVVVLDKGNIKLDGTPKYVFSHVEELKKIGLDIPQSAELSYLLNKENVNLPKDLLTVDDFIEAFEKLSGVKK